MTCVKFTAFCDLRADLRIRLATLHKSVSKFWFCKLALTCVDLWVRLARDLCVARKNDTTGSFQLDIISYACKFLELLTVNIRYGEET